MFWRRSTTKKDIDYKAITEAAYKELLVQKLRSFPANPFDFKFDRREVLILSFKKYCRLSGLTMEQITDNWQLKDGYTVKKLRKNLNLILFDDDAYGPRMRFTLFHELAHIRLNHIVHGPHEENEADCYASQIMSPDAIVGRAIDFGYKPSPLMLTKCFGLSGSASEHKIRFLHTYGPVTTDFDAPLIGHYSDYLFTYFPRRLSGSVDIICDDI